MPAQTFLLLDLVAHPASSRLLFTGKTRYKNYLVTCLFNKAKKVTIVITKTVAKVIRRFAASPAANWDFDPQISLFRGGGNQNSCLTQCYLGPYQCPRQMASHFVQWL